ncbi:hypothetical protein Lpp125_13566 [Lacticaseibacillus paracasei subsp. paracasei Lpp125]|uniref:ImmA/IrrE family metallo-endopeptidase n=1 Tax=Lacticaseibacillus paracasei TaxID=1597 RepID=UPI00034346D1|nr:ImmA/IrrE family metallo-endopeptidase [Lacticaseibacillus paracasei]EPC99193.1 hypothetical protein Lpp125_13566 [Lacticaseibacillus paracasei subsp. paracasei Lpp125]
MVTNRVHVKKELIDWAFNTTDLEIEAKKIVLKKHKWLDPTFKYYLQPSLRQINEFATRLHIPFGALLLKHAPKEEDIRVAFRTRENVPPKVSLTTRDVIYEMQRKQAWFKEESGRATKKLEIIGCVAPKDVDAAVEKLREMLFLNRNIKTARELYKDIRAQIAKHGILNMQKGSAGLGTQRPLKVSEVRAFVILDDYAPLIFINQKDSYTARIFSLIHELVHILHGTDELLQNDRDILEERNINKVTSRFLMPRDEFKSQFELAKRNILKTANYFNVSPQAAAIRAEELHLADPNDIEIPHVENTPPKKKGGNPYNNALSFNDPVYMNALVNSQEQGKLLPTDASALIGISYKMLDRTLKEFNESVEFR